MIPIRRRRIFGSSRRTDAERAAANRQTRRTAAATRPSSLPEALPCYNAMDFYPELLCPLGNVLVTREEDLRPWLADAVVVTKEEAERNGGCIIFAPLVCKGKKGKKATTTTTTSTTVCYYNITRTDDDVYGRATYLAQPQMLAFLDTCTTENSSMVSVELCNGGCGCTEGKGQDGDDVLSSACSATLSASCCSCSSVRCA